jgi:hypothetical protein
MIASIELIRLPRHRSLRRTMRRASTHPCNCAGIATGGPAAGDIRPGRDATGVTCHGSFTESIRNFKPAELAWPPGPLAEELDEAVALMAAPA